MAQGDISQSRLFEWLTGDEDSRLCQDIPDSACREQPRNAVLHLVASVGNKLADELSSARLVLPWLLGVIGGPAWMVGMLVPIREAGALLPQLLFAGLIRQHRRRQWAWAIGSILQAGCAAALAVLALQGEGGWGGALVLAVVTMLSLSRGLSSIATKDVLGKTIAKRQRGTLMGWSGSVASATTLLAGAVLLGFDDRPGQLALAILLSVGACGWAINALCAARIREAPGAIEGGDSIRQSLASGLRLLRDDRTFRHFNLARGLLLASALALPYVALMGQQQSGAELGGLGILILVSGIAGMLASPLWGKRADTSSRRVLRDGGLGTAACCLLGASIAWWPEAWSQQVWPYALVYALLVIVHAGIRLGRKTYVVDMASQQQRSLYVALSNTFTGILMLLVGGVIGGLAQWLGTAPLLLLLALCGLAAALTSHRLPEAE
ncbi:MFS transporter [Halomonas sp. 18H]|uniref:MFS transporter n=1 Tax=Halomonas almeriensis TaxID=308163 RepID=UPI0022309762|nr:MULTISPECIES: MFS transporter [Halomonas]MCW4149574.1 MFS transporter [Halomonas sp. 18H]MDN3553480.1 MFS transporter [Halomonas almeriensis]